MKSDVPRIAAFLDQNCVAHDALWVSFAERIAPKVGRFQDEIDAIEDETRFALELDAGDAPLSTESQVHLGEGGSTTAYFQKAKLVGFSSRLRDPWNFTILICIDLR
jgi:hypothetical protein